jgi:hypothetical protein
VKRRRTALFSVVIISVVVVAGSSVFWLIVTPDVDFWLDPNLTYQKVAGNWVTINSENSISLNGSFMSVNCRNSGALTANFEITIVFSGASFSTDTPMPYQQINSTAAKFAFTLIGYQQKNANVYFTITNSTRFIISISLQTSQSLFRILNAQKTLLGLVLTENYTIPGTLAISSFQP